MAQQSIGPGPGNLAPEQETRSFLSAATVVVGDVIAFSGATGYTVGLASDILVPIGVAKEAASSGDWFDVIISGWSDAVICTATDVGDKDLLYAVAAGECDGIPFGTDVGVQGGGLFGMALEAMTDLLITKSYIFKRI